MNERVPLRCCGLRFKGSTMSGYEIRSVLVASDLEEGSDTVMKLAGAVAAATRADLHAVHTLDPTALDYSAARSVQNDIRSAQRTLEDQASHALPPSVVLRSHWVTLLEPYRAIVHRAGEVSADLIVVGPHRGPK